MSGRAIWITGLPGSGKSVIADEIKKVRPEIIILRMDEFRKIVTPNPTYSDSERDLVYRGFVFLAKTITEAGHDVIIDATGNRKRWRDLARECIPRYLEVYLKCPLEICISREEQRRDTRGAPDDIYRKGRSGAPVPGLNAPYEESDNPEIVIETAKTAIKEAIEIISSYLAVNH